MSIQYSVDSINWHGNSIPVRLFPTQAQAERFAQEKSAEKGLQKATFYVRPRFADYVSAKGAARPLCAFRNGRCCGRAGHFADLRLWTLEDQLRQQQRQG